MTDPTKKDAELDEYLAGDSELSRAYREASGELPPAHLDARILSEARRADAPAPATPGAFSGRWMVPASLAVIVLAVSVVVLLPEPQRPLPEISESTEDRGLREERAGPGTAGEAAADLAPAPARPDLKKSVETGAAKRRYRSSVTAGDEDGAAGSGVAAPEADVVPRSMEDSLSAPASRLPEAPAESKVFTESGIVRGRQVQEQNEQGTRRRELRAPAMEALPEREPLTREPALSSPPGSQSPPTAASSASADNERSFATPPDAAAWLARIADLVAQGKTDDAVDELRAFRQRYPSVEIPPDIRSALEPAE